MIEAFGGGVAMIDYDGDGLIDLFFTGGGFFEGDAIKGRPCKLFKNLGNWKFRDVSAEVGLDKIDFYTHGCAVGDYDRDGWPDLVVTGYGRVALFHNEGGRRFVDVTTKSGLRETTWATNRLGRSDRQRLSRSLHLPLLRLVPGQQPFLQFAPSPGAHVCGPNRSSLSSTPCTATTATAVSVT